MNKCHGGTEDTEIRELNRIDITSAMAIEND